MVIQIVVGLLLMFSNKFRLQHCLSFKLIT